MSNLVNITLLVVGGAGAVYLLKKAFSGGKKPKKIVVVDPEAQKLYDLQKHPKTEIEEKNLTLEERIELSWQFLVNIKDQVLSKFSKPDQERVTQAGHALAQNGARYLHDVEQEIKITQSTSRAQTVAKSKEEGPKGRAK
jgi:hypothetical protein